MMRALSFALMAAACVLAAVIVPRFHPSAQVCLAVQAHQMRAALHGRFAEVEDSTAQTNVTESK